MHLCLHCMNEITENDVLLCQTCSKERGFSCTKCGGSKNLVKFTPLREKKAQTIVDEWNDTYEVGQDVMVKEDFKPKGTLTKTKSAAQVICQDAVVWLDGISGCYSLTHVTPV